MTYPQQLPEKPAGWTRSLICHLNYGDGYEWLNRYCFDNDMGKKAYEAGWEGDMRPITQAADLLWLIEGGADDKEATWAEA